MADSCPFKTNFPGNLRIPPVPVDVNADVPNVPRPSGDITTQDSSNMGGTTPPIESTRNSNGWLQNQVFQVRPPHPQNTLEPCSIAGKAPLMSADANDRPFEKNALLADPNSRRRRCFNIYDTGQGMVGRVCTAMGTDGVLDSREGYDGIGVNGNADWVRGNRFGVNYNSRMIDDRIEYKYKTPALLQGNKEYVTYDPFYPTPDFCKNKNCWSKFYPHTKLYTNTGYPTWRYPYHTAQPGSRAPTYRLTQIDDVIEGFDEKRLNVRFWLGTLVIMGSVFYLSKMK